jgi:hypothetical protein
LDLACLATIQREAVSAVAIQRGGALRTGPGSPPRARALPHPGRAVETQAERAELAKLTQAHQRNISSGGALTAANLQITYVRLPRAV